MALLQNLAVGGLSAAGAQAARNMPTSTTGLVNTAAPSIGAMLAAYVAGKLYDPSGKMGTITAAAVTGIASGLTTNALSNSGDRGSVKQWIGSTAAGTLANWFVEGYVNA